MAKKDPAWKIMGLDGPPPVVNGYHHYGVVYRAEDGPQRESLRHAWDTATWSWMYWAKKVRRDIEAVRAEGGRGTLGARALDRVAMGFVRLAVWGHRPKG